MAGLGDFKQWHWIHFGGEIRRSFCAQSCAAPWLQSPAQAQGLIV